MKTTSNQELSNAQASSATLPATRAVRAGTARKTRRIYSKHQHYRLKTAMKVLGSRGLRVFDRRTALGKAASRWRRDLVRDLGGDPSTAACAVIDLALRTKVMLDSIDAWLLKQPSIINRRKKALLPVVMQRQVLADALARYLALLGLERRAQPVPSLDEYLADGKPQ